MFRKFAAFDVLEASLAPTGGSALRTYAHRHAFTYEPRPGYLYVRSRAISSRTNDNFDTFPAEEIKSSFLSFIGKPVFVNHNNDNHRRARGVIIDAALHEDRNPDGSPDTWAEVLMEVDAVRFPKLAKAILAGDIDRTSMGTDVAYSLCSFCGNKATTPMEYCAHIPKMKGKRIYRTTASGTKEGVLVSEICHGLKFFENSLLVEEPADPTAFFTGVEGHGVAKTAMIQTPIQPRPKPTTPPARPAKPTSWLANDALITTAMATGGEITVNFEDGISVEATERKRLKDMSEGEVKAFRKHQESGRRWNRQNPAHADNIIAHWNACTPHERTTGMNWYQDAHHLTKHVASDTGTPLHTAAGLMSNYSPQTHWATNMLNAAKSMKTKAGIGGSGSGVFATSKQKRAADRLHAGEHYDKVLSGPKTHAFAHLIHHGGNADPSKPKVVIDRHALSVAAGKRAKDIDYEMSGLGGKKRYAQVADEYHKAAQHISKHTGIKVEAHQVQAATWLARQRLNAGEDKKMASYRKISNDAVNTWNDYAGEHHPMAMGKEPGTGYSSPKDAPEDVHHADDLVAEGHHGTLHAAVPPSNPQRKDRTGFGRTAGTYLAFGETKAPEDVDTLRDEECPVCGEADAYDGNRCDVCGFDAPPKMFQDPDLDMAKQLDLRKDIAQDQMTDPNGDGFPDVIPGHGGMGDESVPPMPGMVPDPQDVAQQQVNEVLENQAPLDPSMLDANGQPVAPPDPMAQDMPMDPNALPMDPTDIATSDPLDPFGQSEPGTPGDAAADLVCPACGFQQGATPPQSVDMDETPSSISGATGALCPQCQSAPLMSIQDLDQMGNEMGQVPVNVRAAALAFPIILSPGL